MCSNSLVSEFGFDCFLVRIWSTKLMIGCCCAVEVEGIGDINVYTLVKCDSQLKIKQSNCKRIKTVIVNHL